MIPDADDDMGVVVSDGDASDIRPSDSGNQSIEIEVAKECAKFDHSDIDNGWRLIKHDDKYLRTREIGETNAPSLAYGAIPIGTGQNADRRRKFRSRRCCKGNFEFTPVFSCHMSGMAIRGSTGSIMAFGGTQPLCIGR